MEHRADLDASAARLVPKYRTRQDGERAERLIETAAVTREVPEQDKTVREGTLRGGRGACQVTFRAGGSDPP
jgi:hypothetical protein